MRRALLQCGRTSTFLKRLLSVSTQQKSTPGSLSESLRERYASRLTQRTLVRVEGEEAGRFLQGMVTADMEEEREAGRAFYSMMLNAQGRVLYDILLYPLSMGAYFLECDSGVSDDVIRHLRKYALRAKVSFSPAVEDYSVWALFPGQPTQPISSHHRAICSPDPRAVSFGSRAILPSDVKVSEVWPDLEVTDADAYHDHRLLSGIPEGTDDITVGGSLPLEFNLDYMNGVSFSKGCYLGQELTARTHHTGVIRKRVMPVLLDPSPSSPIAHGTSIASNSGRSAGKLLEHQGSLGLALLRLQEIAKGSLTVPDDDGHTILVSAHRPEFWPEAPE